MGKEENISYEDTVDAVAVIGLAGRFPGAGNIHQFWRNLQDGKESIRHFTDQELEDQGVPSEWLRDPNYVKAGTVLEDYDKFDALVFGYSPKEAENIDPQQRIFLETAWEALESAGYNRKHTVALLVFSQGPTLTNTENYSRELWTQEMLLAH